MPVLAANTQPPHPSIFRARTENERIGLLIRRVIPQKQSIRHGEHADSALSALKHAMRKNGGGRENVGNTDLEDELDCGPRKRKAPEAEANLPSGGFSLFGGAVSITPPTVGNGSEDSMVNSRVVHLSSADDKSAAHQGDIWGPPPSLKSSSSSTSSTHTKSKAPGSLSLPSMMKIDAGKNKVKDSTSWKTAVVEDSTGNLGAGGLNLKMDDFRGAEKFCRNAGKQRNGLHGLLRIMNSNLDSPVALGLVWCDSTSNHFETTGKKVCKPSQQCNIWYCSCNRYIRVDRSYRPVLGVFLRFPEAEEQSHCYYIPLAPALSDISAPQEGGSKSFVLPFTCETTLKDRWGAFYSILCSSRSKIIYHAKLACLPILRNLELHGFDSSKLQNILDPRVGAYLVSEEEDTSSEEPLELNKLCAQYGISNEVRKCDADGRIGKVIEKVWRELRLVSELHDAIFVRLTQTGTLMFYKELEMKVVVEMAKLELLGIHAEPAGFEKIMRQLTAKITQLEKEAATIAGTNFNLASPEQVSEILYNRLQIPPPASTSAKGKHFSTSEQDLKARAADYPIVQCILDYRACRKITTTFDWRNFLYDSAKERGQGGDSVGVASIASNSYSNAHNHVVASQLSVSPSRSPSSLPKANPCLRIHPRWNLGFTRTGRLSCSSPNLQQVPKEFSVRDFSINVRSLFLPPSHDGDCVFVAADYSQIEMRVLACACRDLNLIRLFQRETEDCEDLSAADFYRIMASQIYGKPISDVSGHERSVAKTISLGIIYGMGADQTAARLSITRAAAAQIIQKFHSLFPAVSRWVSTIRDRARMSGFVQTMGNFRRYLPNITSSDSNKKAAAERQSVNTIIQGSASEMIKLAMISMSAAIEGEEWELASQSLVKPVLVASIHDELLYSVRRPLVPKLIQILRRTMEIEVPAKFRLPLKFSVTVSSGENWGELKEWAPYA